MTDTTAALFEEKADGVWRPQAYASGPFDGLQGGALAGLMCAAAERSFEAGFQTLSIDAHFLRPCPLATIELSVRPIQAGGRLTVADVTLTSQDKVRAYAVVTAARPIVVEGLSQLFPVGHQPWLLPSRAAPKPHGRPWLMDRMEARTSADGTLWFKFATPVTGTESAFARALCVADWLPGITRADSWERPLVAAAPNVDLGVRLDRYPVGEWIGLAAKGRWNSNGVGSAHAELLDVDGSVGSVSCAVVLVPK